MKKVRTVWIQIQNTGSIKTCNLYYYCYKWVFPVSIIFLSSPHFFFVFLFLTGITCAKRKVSWVTCPFISLCSSSSRSLNPSRSSLLFTTTASLFLFSPHSKHMPTNPVKAFSASVSPLSQADYANKRISWDLRVNGNHLPYRIERLPHNQLEIGYNQQVSAVDTWR